MRAVGRSVLSWGEEAYCLCLLRLNQNDPGCCLSLDDPDRGLSLMLFRFISIHHQDQEKRAKLVEEESGLTPKQIISDG